MSTGPPENSAPGRRNPDEKPLSDEDGRSVSKLSRPGGRVKRLIAGHRRLAPLEAFLGRLFWAIQARRCRIADELARLGVHPFDKPSTGGAR
jgi:hypothetical protein